MRYFLLTLICFLFSQQIFSQNTDLKYIKNCNENNQVLEEGWVHNGKRVNYWYQYYDNGTIKSKGNYKDNKKNGYWYLYLPNGNLKSEGHYLDNNKCKWWITYGDEEQILFKCQYLNNIKQGYSLCYSNGKLYKSEKYINDKKVDEWTSFWKFKLSNNLDDLK